MKLERTETAIGGGAGQRIVWRLPGGLLAARLTLWKNLPPYVDLPNGYQCITVEDANLIAQALLEAVREAGPADLTESRAVAPADLQERIVLTSGQTNPTLEELLAWERWRCCRAVCDGCREGWGYHSLSDCHRRPDGVHVACDALAIRALSEEGKSDR